MYEHDNQIQGAVTATRPRYSHMAESEPGYGDDCDDTRWLAQAFADSGYTVDPTGPIPAYLLPLAEDLTDARLERATTHRANWVRAAVALATSDGIQAAATRSGLCVRTLQRLQRKPEFVDLLHEAQRRAIRHRLDSGRTVRQIALTHLERLLQSADDRIVLRAAQTLAALGDRAII